MVVDAGMLTFVNDMAPFGSDLFLLRHGMCLYGNIVLPFGSDLFWNDLCVLAFWE